LDSRVLCDQELNERTKQRFASLSDIGHKLEETQVKSDIEQVLREKKIVYPPLHA
jgi:hypothetical protein